MMLPMLLLMMMILTMMPLLMLMLMLMLEADADAEAYVEAYAWLDTRRWAFSRSPGNTTWHPRSQLVPHPCVSRANLSAAAAILTVDGQNPALPIIRNIPEFP